MESVVSKLVERKNVSADSIRRQVERIDSSRMLLNTYLISTFQKFMSSFEVPQNFFEQFVIALNDAILSVSHLCVAKCHGQ